jgi:type I restriction enzyme M protein
LAARRRKKDSSGGNGDRKGSLGFEQQLWGAADLLRNNLDPAEYKHVTLGLLFLKYISDAFADRQGELAALVTTPGSDYYVEGDDAQEAELAQILEDPDEYTSEHVFWVPPEARWDHLQASAKQPTIGKLVDGAMDAIERDNPTLKGVLPKIFARPDLDKPSLGKLIDLISGIGLGTAEGRAQDTLGRVYEYFLARFASAEGKGGGEFYTPESVVRTLVELIEPYEGRVYDPCCGSGGMFVQSLRFLDSHGGQKDKISVYGQESNPTTWRLARMNLAIRGIGANLGPTHADTFRKDLHPDLRANFILANPPFNISEWHGETLREDVRWRFGAPPVGNANFAWVQHMVHHLAPGGTAGFVLANGSMSSMQSGEGEIRRKLVEDGLVDCIVAMPGQLFYATPIPVCLWILSKGRRGGGGFRDRRGQILFIDARELGHMETRVHRILSDQDVQRIAGTYHAWRNAEGRYEDAPGFAMSAALDEVKTHECVLTPGRYVGAADDEGEVEPFDERMKRLAGDLRTQQAKSLTLDAAIATSLRRLGYGE